MDRKSFVSSLLTGSFVAGSFLGCKPKHSTPEGVAPRAPEDELAERLYEHTITVYCVAALYIGDRLGLFRAMSGSGAVTAAQLAAKTGLDKRYLLEWLRTLATSGYLEYRADSDAFELTPAQVAVLVDEDSSVFSSGLVEATLADLLMVPRVMAEFRTGKGIPYGDYPLETFEGIERLTRPDYLHLLTQHWLPAIPGMVERLRQGGTAADLGSGAGLASLAIAREFPEVHVFGYEPYAPSVDRARANAHAGGLSSRATFATFDGIHVPGGPYQLVTINYSLHHAGDPVALLRGARQTLARDGNLLVVEYRKSVRLQDDEGTLRAGFYGIGLLECMPAALAEGGPGYGTGMTEADLRLLARQAGFRQFTRVLPADPIRILVVLRG